MATQIKSHSNTIIGAIAGDIIGSAYECDSPKSTSFKLLRPEATFTDDTVQTIAIADSLLNKKILLKTFPNMEKLS